MEISALCVAEIFAGLVVLISLWHLYCRVSIPKVSIKDAYILITGGSEGIGFSVAKACIMKGGNVAILARNKQKLSNAEQQLNKLRVSPQTQQVVSIAADVSDYKSMQDAISSAFHQHGWTQLDGLVCNAGCELVATLEETSMENYQRIMNINYFGVVHAIKICLPYLKVNKVNEGKYGRILVTSSLLGLMAMSYYSAYASSKWALRGFVESIYAELTAMNIYTSIVYPPDVKTAQYQREKQVSIPKSVKELSAQADVFEPDQVGRDMMSMMENGEYHRSWGLDGWLVLNATAGFGITWSWTETLAQVLGMGVFRAILMWYIQNMYRVCKDSFGKKEK